MTPNPPVVLMLRMTGVKADTDLMLLMTIREFVHVFALIFNYFSADFHESELHQITFIIYIYTCVITVRWNDSLYFALYI